DDKRHGRCAGQPGRRPESAYPGDPPQAFPHSAQQRLSSPVQGIERDRKTLAAGAVSQRQRGEKIERGFQPDDSLVVLSPRLELFGRHGGGWIELWDIELVEQPTPSPENAEMRAVHLVRGPH